MNANSYFLARRNSNRIEPDFLQESMFEDDENNCSYDFCKSLVSKMKDKITIPSECQQYPDVMIDLKRRNSKEKSPSAYVGCHAGLVREAQLTRRLTSGRSGLPK